LVCSIDAAAPESVHLCDFPTVEESWIDTALEADMDEVLKVVVLGRACRNASNIKQRQPIANMFVCSERGALNEFYCEIIEDELNVKALSFTDDVSELTSYSFKPQLKTLGKRFGKQINTVRELLANIDGRAAMKELDETGALTLVVDGVSESIAKEDLLIESQQTEGYVSDSDGGITVVLDTRLTPELIEEGYVREVISKVQTMRKEAGFEVMDHITVALVGNDKLAEVCNKNSEFLCRVVLADELRFDAVEGYTKDWNINGEDVTITVVKK
ncbi:MAG: isoleucine--tRNA ligase, partial [Lachnospiraceae bacterium]|nr:isoleucine--tRNA ligase [Lachnospiraceae bacterium]